MSDPVRSERVRELGDVAREMEKLTQRPEWKTLRDLFEKRRAAYLNKLARQIASGGINAPPIDEREIAYQRGFLRGAQAVLNTPENAIQALEAELRKEGESRDG